MLEKDENNGSFQYFFDSGLQIRLGGWAVETF
jgi:hypothetical protein